jgi:hypothetical protein
MKYMLMMNTPGGGPYQIAQWPQAAIKAHIAFMIKFNKEIHESGELVAPRDSPGRTRRSSCAPAKTARR